MWVGGVNFQGAGAVFVAISHGVCLLVCCVGMPLQYIYYGYDSMSPHRKRTICHMSLFYVLFREFIQDEWVDELEEFCREDAVERIDGIVDMVQFVESFYLNTAHYDIDAHLTLRRISTELLELRLDSMDMDLDDSLAPPVLRRQVAGESDTHFHGREEEEEKEEEWMTEEQMRMAGWLASLECDGEEFEYESLTDSTESESDSEFDLDVLFP